MVGLGVLLIDPDTIGTGLGGRGIPSGSASALGDQLTILSSLYEWSMIACLAASFHLQCDSDTRKKYASRASLPFSRFGKGRNLLAGWPNVMVLSCCKAQSVTEAVEDHFYGFAGEEVPDRLLSTDGVLLIWWRELLPSQVIGRIIRPRSARDCLVEARCLG